jgi:glutathione S-transferase
MSEPYRIYGSNASPFSCKLRAVLRYRRLPHSWHMRRPGMAPEIEAVKPKLVPILYLPSMDGKGGEYRVDSTPLVHELERRHPGARSVLPPDAGDAFLCHLVEDFADEWCTKMMYYHRWIEEPTARFGAAWIIQDWLPEAAGTARSRMEEQIFTRQRGRMPLVLGDAGNYATIEADFHALLACLGPYVSGARFLFGSRPSLADFALYGQLSQLVTDPLPQARVRELAPAIEFWVMALDDASGLEGSWNAELPGAADARKGLLALVGASYLPFLAANAAALAAGKERFELEIGGRPWAQAPFGYQAKCYSEIRNRWAALGEAALAGLRPLLGETGCLPYLD